MSKLYTGTDFVIMLPGFVCMQSCNAALFLLQLSLPTAFTGRFGHTSVMFGTGPDFRAVVTFGGRDPHKILSDTTILLLCKYC